MVSAELVKSERKATESFLVRIQAERGQAEYHAGQFWKAQSAKQQNSLKNTVAILQSHSWQYCNRSVKA